MQSQLSQKRKKKLSRNNIHGALNIFRRRSTVDACNRLHAMSQSVAVVGGKILVIIFTVFFLIAFLALYSLHGYTKWFWKLFVAGGDGSKVEEHLDADCVVCLSRISRSEKLSVLPACNHGFHVHCIMTWLKYHPTCPLCRKPVTPLPPQLQHDCLDPSLFRTIGKFMENSFNSDLSSVICEIISNLEF